MNGKVIIGTKLDTKSFDAQIKQVERELDLLEKSADESSIPEQFRRSEEETNKLNAEIEKAKNKLGDLKKKQTKLNQEQAQMGKLDLSGVQVGIDNVNKGLNKTLKKVAKWSLAIFGVRSAYMAVRSAMSTISQYEDGMKSNIDYIKYALAYTLKPVIEWILNAVVKLLQYVNYIAKAWTGKNLFKTADAFKSAQKSANGVAKSAKEINKQLAGFDEMNVLQAPSSGGGADGTDIKAPNIDLTGLQGEIPSWVQWIVDNKDILISALSGIAGGIIAIKLGADLLMGLGIGLIIAGIAKTVKAIVDFIKDPSWDNFAKILEGLAIILAGVAIAMLAVNAANPVAWIILAIAAVVALVAAVIKNWDKIKEILSKVGSWINENVIQPIVNFFTKLWEKIKEIFSPVIDFFVGIFDTIWKNFKITIDNVLQFLGALWDGIKTLFTPVVDFFGDIFSLIWDTVKNFVSTFKNLFKEAWNAVKETFSPFVSFFSNLFSKVGTKLKEWGGKVGDIIGGAFKGAINGVLKAIETILNTPIMAINGLISIINKVPGINLTKLKTFSLPRLAKGGIINQPGRGIPVGYNQAIGGERGQEGVIPLTDSQQMQLLGEAIGRYVTINANITNTMNGRVISRELQKVNNTNDFAFNR